MISIMIYAALIIVFFIITFFGLGPVILADGTTRERLFTLAIVMFMYAALALLGFYFIKRSKRDKEQQ